MCHKSHVTSHVSQVTCQVSSVIFKTPSQPNRWSLGAEILTECPPPPTWLMLCVTCHVSCVTCHKSRFTCHMSSSKHFQGQSNRARELKFWKVSRVIFKTPSKPNRLSWGAEILTECPHHQMFPLSCVMCHVPCVLCHVLCVTSHMSLVMFHMSHVIFKTLSRPIC